MYAIVDIAGQQFKVEKDQKIYVHRLEGNEGDTLEFDRVLLIENGEKILVGEPLLKGAMVTGKILAHPKGDKVIVFKKKRRKGYKVKTGHRQYLTHVLIESIVESGAMKKPKAEKEPKAEKVKKETLITQEEKVPATKAMAKKTPAAMVEKAEGKKSVPVKKAAPKEKPASKAKSADKKEGTVTKAAKKPAAKTSAAKAAPKAPAKTTPKPAAKPAAKTAAKKTEPKTKK